jgi:hypothetical protein
MIGDFHGSTSALWNLYGKEAKSHDDARIRPLKEDMNGVLIFVRLRAYNRLSHVDIYLYRPVYFRLPSLRLWLIANRTCKLAPQIK